MFTMKVRDDFELNNRIFIILLFYQMHIFSWTISMFIFMNKVNFTLTFNVTK